MGRRTLTRAELEAAEKRARRDYRVTHWGLGGEKATRSLECVDVCREGPLVELGQLVSVVYLTRKLGDRGPTEYEHDFSGSLPVLAYSGEGKRLVVAGGSYRVTPRGIVG